MITLGQKASVKRNGKTVSGKVVFVTNGGEQYNYIASFLPEGKTMEIFFHESKYNGKHYTALGQEVTLK